MYSYKRKVLQALDEAHSLNLDEALEIITNEQYALYEVESFDELIDEMIDEGLFGEISPELIGYLDYEKIARDLEYDGYRMTSVGVIFIY